MPDTQPGLSLWPSEFGVVGVQTPVAILRQQGALLGELTQNIVVGRVTTHAGGGGMFIHRFSLYCSPLGYQEELFRVTHEIDHYPAVIHAPTEENKHPLIAQDAEDFRRKLKDVFARDKTKKIIASLLAQSRQ